MSFYLKLCLSFRKRFEIFFMGLLCTFDSCPSNIFYFGSHQELDFAHHCICINTGVQFTEHSQLWVLVLCRSPLLRIRHSSPLAEQSFLVGFSSWNFGKAYKPWHVVFIFRKSCISFIFTTFIVDLKKLREHKKIKRRESTFFNMFSFW